MKTYTKLLNQMCENCQHRDNLCDGSYDSVFTGCVMKNANPEYVSEYFNELKKISFEINN